MVTSFTEKSRKGGQTTPTFALPLPPGYPLGIALEHKRNYREALQEYRTAYELNPHGPDYRKAYERLLKRTRQ
jgi:hypothetical protein